jgi:hypothetical protein
LNKLETDLGHSTEEIHGDGNYLYIVRWEKEVVVVSIFVSLFSFRTLASRETDVMAGGVRRSGERCNDGYVKEEPSTTDSKRQIRAVRATFIVGIRGVRNLLVGELVAQVVPDEGLL